MQSLTGLTGFYWLLFFGYALALVLVIQSRRAQPDGERVGGMLAVPLVAGAMLAVFLVLAYRSETRYLLSHITDRVGSVPVAIMAVVTAVAFADLFFARLTTLAGHALSKARLSDRNRADLALVLGVGVPAVVALVAIPRLHDHFSRTPATQAKVIRVAPGVVQAEYRIPGQPLDLLLRSPTSALVSFAQGSIARLELPQDPADGLKVTTLAKGLQWPRGITIVGNTLYVAELGALPCRPAFPSCKGGDVKGESVDDTERKILRTSRARVLAFHIQDDGSLSNRRVILRDLPVANTDHGVNDLVTGPDGRIYLSIGHLDAIYSSHKLKRDLIRPHVDLLGTVVSFKPDGTDLRVYAKGLRNVFGLAFDSRGQLYGADNNGPTRNGDQLEELLRIEQGADYGYPDVPRRPSTPPTLRFLDTVGSGGIAWVPGADNGGRLFLGSCAGVDTVPLTLAPDGEPRVDKTVRPKRLRDLPGCVTAIQPRPTSIVVTVFTSGGRGKLYVIPWKERS